MMQRLPILKVLLSALAAIWFLVLAVQFFCWPDLLHAFLRERC